MDNRLQQNDTKKASASFLIPGDKNYSLIPLILLIIIVPLFMRLHVYNPNLSEFSWFANTDKSYDIFLYYKGVILSILAGIMLIILFIKLVTRSFPKLNKAYWLFFLSGYGLLAFLSTVFSEYRYYGFNGMYEQFESIWVILSYCIVTFYTFVIVRNEKDLDTIKKAFFVMLAIMCLIGMTQFIGKDFFSSTLGKKLIIPEKHADLRDILNFKFSDNATHQVYLTLYNPNYVGVFTALLVPITIILVPASKGIAKKIAWTIISILLFICAFGSGSKAFLISLVAVTFIAILLCRKYFLRFYIPVLIAVCIFVVTIRGAFAYIGTNPIEYVKKALTIKENTTDIEKIETTDTDLLLTYKGETLMIRYLNVMDRFIYEFRDANGDPDKRLDIVKNGPFTFKLTDERFDGLKFSYYSGVNGYDFIASIKHNNEIFFTITEEDGPIFLNPVLKPIDPEDFIDSESAVFTNYHKLLSGRGFLWSKSIPLLKDSIFLGSGADTFAIMFPHNDYIARINTGIYNSLITKPHSLYLQIGVQHGVVALICFLVVCLWYVAQSFKLYWKTDFSNKNHLLGVGLMLGVIGYLILGITNDSTVTIAPLFWLIIGLGFAVNRINKNVAKESC